MSATSRDVPRTVLPIPDRRHVGLVTFDAKDPETAYPPIEPLRPPAGAPNVLVILIDDVGFGASSAFGGPCRTPTAERLASQGLKFTRSTRRRCVRRRGRPCCLVTEIATSAPGYNSLAGRPVLVRGTTRLLFSGMGRLSENSVLNLKNKSHAVTAR